MTDRRRRLGALLLAGALGLPAGCGGEPSATADEGIRPDTNPAATVVSPTPVLPDTVRDRDRSGAEAATRYFFEALSYAEQTGDPKPVRAVSTRDCGGCARVLASIRDAYAGGGSVRGGWYTVRETTGAEYSAAIPLLDVVFDRDALSIVGTGGATMQTVPAVTFQAARVRLAFAGKWRVAEIGGLAPLGSAG